MGGDGGYQGKSFLSCSVGGVIKPGSGNRKCVITLSLLIKQWSCSYP